MKKFIAPIVLFVLASALAVYLTMDLSAAGKSFDAESYLAARSKIDSLELALWNARSDADAQVNIRLQLDSAWENLSAMRSVPESAAGEQVTTVGGFPLSADTIKWILGGALAVVLCIIILVFILRKRQEIITRRMEAIKAERFKEPKAGLDDATIPPRPHREKRSIIADVEAYAAQKREALAAEETLSQGEEEPKVAFEDENGVPENKILTGVPDSKPTLRPTAKERITSAMQNLSDVLRAPRGLSRERTMKIRAQSRNLTGNPNLKAQSPLEVTRFDRESNEKVKILQMSRRGFPASAIASSLKISQEKVEAVIKEAMG
ncbi:MAG: hypothetical protein IKO21_07530 [Fibrobacter sp.]|nr:hypothetical protein [Fibrobacter sp.]